ncbi:hypothetical protein ACSBR1_016714 [Camellia fascicularis]
MITTPLSQSMTLSFNFRELLLDFYVSSGKRKPDQIIIFRCVPYGRGILVPQMVHHKVIADLWISSILGSYCNLLTLLYISFVFLHTVHVLYEKFRESNDRDQEIVCSV